MIKARINKNKKGKRDYVKRLAKNILKGSLDASAWSFSFLVAMSEATIEAFLSPSYYADLPNGSTNFFDTKELEKKGKEFKKSTIRQSISRLQKHGFVEKQGSKYYFTKKGKEAIEYILNRKKILNKKWDKKYRVVIFDIPEKKRIHRDWLRSELYLLEYKQLQKSVFVSKYPLTEDIVKEIKARGIGDFVDYLLVEKIYSKFMKKGK